LIKAQDPKAECTRAPPRECAGDHKPGQIAAPAFTRGGANVAQGVDIAKKSAISNKKFIFHLK